MTHESRPQKDRVRDGKGEHQSSSGVVGVYPITTIHRRGEEKGLSTNKPVLLSTGHYGFSFNTTSGLVLSRPVWCGSWPATGTKDTHQRSERPTLLLGSPTLLSWRWTVGVPVATRGLVQFQEGEGRRLEPLAPESTSVRTQIHIYDGTVRNFYFSQNLFSETLC